jgi:hypothetical protein
MSEDSPIDKLFREKLGEASINSDNSEWLDIEQGLTRSRFMRFSLYHFNVYYASLICFTFLFSTAVFLRSYAIKQDLKSGEEEPVSETQKEQFMNENSGKKGITDTVNGEMITKKKTITRSELINKLKEGNKKEVMADSLGKASGDNLNKTNEGDNKEVHKQYSKEVEEKEIIYITQQDTLIVIDTMKVSRKRQRRK